MPFDTLEEPQSKTAGSDAAQIALFEGDDFEAKLQELSSRYTQDWQTIVSQAAKKANDTQFDKGLTMVGICMAVMSGSGGISVVGEGAADTIGLVGFVTALVGMLAAVPFVEHTYNAPRWAKKAKISKPVAVTAQTKVHDDARVSALIVCSDGRKALEIELGKHNQEEIASRFLTVKETCAAITATNAASFSPDLLVQNGLSAKCKPLPTKEQRLQLTAEKQWQEHEHKLLHDANVELAKALDNQ